MPIKLILKFFDLDLYVDFDLAYFALHCCLVFNLMRGFTTSYLFLLLLYLYHSYSYYLALFIIYLYLSLFVVPWCNGYHTAQLHSTKPEHRFCAGSNLARGMSEIRDGENL